MIGKFTQTITWFFIDALSVVNRDPLRESIAVDINPAMSDV